MKITQTKDIRASNRWEIMGLVLRHWPISRADICRRTGLNKATVSTIVKEWLDAGLLRETELGRSEGGRKPILLKPREEAGCTVALDLDIRRVRAILTDLSGEKVLAREQFSIEEPDFPQVYSQLCQGVDRLLKHMPPSRYGLVGVGVAVHGVVDLSGLIRFIPRLGWRNVDLRSLLEERYGVPVAIDNDGNLAALAQRELMGAGTDPALQSLAVVNIGESISAGSSPAGRCCGAFTALPTPSATTPSTSTSRRSAPAASTAAGSSTARTAPCWPTPTPCCPGPSPPWRSWWTSSAARTPWPSR